MKTYTKEQLKEILEKHQKWLNGEEGGERATLRGATLTGATLTDTTLTGANLRGANLAGATLTGADLDYSCWPLWCGSLNVKVDKRIFAQLAYHLCRVIVDDEECKAAQAALYPIANQFHRVEECGRLPITREDEK